jgi:hypothetical protein
MVIIIDDRYDVWGTCKNLVRIEPFTFYIRDSETMPLPATYTVCTRHEILHWHVAHLRVARCHQVTTATQQRL